MYIVVLKKDEPKNQHSDKAIKANVKGSQKDDDWKEVGRKNKTSHTRTVC
jgi:hypothetical protein